MTPNENKPKEPTIFEPSDLGISGTPAGMRFIEYTHYESALAAKDKEIAELHDKIANQWMPEVGKLKAEIENLKHDYDGAWESGFNAALTTEGRAEMAAQISINHALNLTGKKLFEENAALKSELELYKDTTNLTKIDIEHGIRLEQENSKLKSELDSERAESAIEVQKLTKQSISQLGEILELKSQLETAVKALEFYADSKNFYVGMDDEELFEYNNGEHPFGQIARNALEQLKRGQKVKDGDES